MERFIDGDDDPEKIEDGYTFYNKAVSIRLESIKDTTKENFKEFLLKIHTINMTWAKCEIIHLPYDSLDFILHYWVST